MTAGPWGEAARPGGGWGGARTVASLLNFGPPPKVSRKNLQTLAPERRLSFLASFQRRNTILGSTHAFSRHAHGTTLKRGMRTGCREVHQVRSKTQPLRHHVRGECPRRGSLLALLLRTGLPGPPRVPSFLQHTNDLEKMPAGHGRRQLQLGLAQKCRRGEATSSGAAGASPGRTCPAAAHRSRPPPARGGARAPEATGVLSRFSPTRARSPARSEGAPRSPRAAADPPSLRRRRHRLPGWPSPPGQPHRASPRHRPAAGEAPRAAGRRAGKAQIPA